MEVTVNGQLKQVADGTTVAALLHNLGIATKQVAVEVNLELVPRDAQATRTLYDGDRLEVVTLVGGG